MQQLPLDANGPGKNPLVQAQERGIPCPVIAEFPIQSAQARKMSAAMFGDAIAPPPSDIEPDSVLCVPLTTSQAMRSLWKHCGASGDTLASLLYLPLFPQWWRLRFEEHEILLAPHEGSQSLQPFTVRYGSVSHANSCQTLSDGEYLGTREVQAGAALPPVHAPVSRRTEVGLAETLADARAGGMKDPVLLALDLNSPHAQALYQAEYGESLDRPTGKEGVTTLQVILSDGCHKVAEIVRSADDAAGLLRQHAGNAGVYLAGEIQNRSHGQDSWVVLLTEDCINATPFRDNQPLGSYHSRYDRASGTFTKHFSPQHEGPSILPFLLEDGTTVPICGRNGTDILLARSLVHLILDRRYRGRAYVAATRFGLTDESLSRTLGVVYFDCPHVVAEAIRVLRKIRSHKERTLTRLLWGRKELRKLARSVQNDLTGC